MRNSIFYCHLSIFTLKVYMLFSHFLFLYIFPLLNFLSFDNDEMKLSKCQVSLISLTFIIIIAIIITVIIIIIVVVIIA